MDIPIRFKPAKKNEKNSFVIGSDGEPIPDMDAEDLPLKKQNNTKNAVSYFT